MKFYQDKNKKWHAVGNSHARYWEIRKGYKAFRCLEITRPTVENFCWDHNGRKTFTDEEFLQHLKDHKKAYQIMLKRISNIIDEVKNE